MGLIDSVFGLIFGGGAGGGPRNVVRDTVEVFRENADKGAQRITQVQTEALAQYAAEFAKEKRGLFDRIMDAVNRLPRPAMALGTLGLFGAAMADPIWFAERMQGIALVPEPLWWLLGAVVSFYFGARHQLKNQQFQRQVAGSLALTPQVLSNLDALEGMRAAREPRVSADDQAPEPHQNMQAPATSPAHSPAQNPAPQLQPEPQIRRDPVFTQKPDATFPNNAALAEWAGS